jgi:WD40 repeat protein
VKCLPDTPQIVTADIAGMVKVWDVRNFLCMQTFNVPAEEVNSFCLTYSTTAGQSMKKRIVCASKKMYFYESDEPKDQFLTDEKISLKVIFNETLLVFITLHADCLKVWSAKDGRLDSVYRALSSGELTVAILDSRERKLFVGDSEG